MYSEAQMLRALTFNGAAVTRMLQLVEDDYAWYPVIEPGRVGMVFEGEEEVLKEAVEGLRHWSGWTVEETGLYLQAGAEYVHNPEYYTEPARLTVYVTI